MGNFDRGRAGASGARLESLFCAGYAARDHLRTFDRGHHAAERGSGGPGRRVRRSGQPDGLRPSRSCHVSFQGHDLVRDHVHADVHGADDAPELDFGIHRQLRAAAILEDV